jgi:glyoxylase-like metal-dependent hydrolase (beta-lactamase superfamily II)
MNESATILTPASAQAEDARQAGAESLNGNGFYRFKIGDFQATVISDGYGPIPVGPIFAMNASEAELAPVLKANFMQPMIQATNNILVVDTGRERLLVDTGFGEKLGPSFGSFPGLEANLCRAGITPGSIDLVVTSHCHLDHIGGLVTKSGALAFPKAQFVFVDTEWNYWTGNRYESDVNSSPMPDPFKQATIGAARENLPPVADRSRFVKQGGEIASGVHYIAAPGHSPSHAATEWFSEHLLNPGARRVTQVRATAIELSKRLRINVVNPTILKESEAHMGSFFPGVIPVEEWKVGQAYKRAILGAQTGRVYKVD